jgi:hypothetical protein
LEDQKPVEEKDGSSVSIKVIVHIMGEDPVMAEMEQELQVTDLFIRVTNATRTDGKDLSYLTEGVEAVIFPWHRVTFLEIMGGEGEGSKVIGFFR